jgi:hypothetical protein
LYEAQSYQKIRGHNFLISKILKSLRIAYFIIN